MKAIIYARVSSTDESQSYERQISDLKKYSEYLDLKVDKVFSEKISGFKKGLDERRAFNDMNDYIEQHNIKHILVSELSRLSRRYIDSVNYINDCTKKGICIHILKERLSTLNSDGTENAMVQMLIGMLSSMAQQESATLSHRVRSGQRYAATQGRMWKKVYGYQKSIEGRPEIYEKEAEIVQYIFNLNNNGYGTGTISNMLKELNDIDLTASKIHHILRNSHYIGKRKYKDLILEVPAIIDEETYFKAQKHLDQRKRYSHTPKKHYNPLKTFIRCECGSVFKQIVVPERKVNLYRCGVRCGVKSVNRKFIIDEVRKIAERNAKKAKDQIVRDRLNEKIKACNANIKSLNKQTQKTKRMRDKNYERFLQEKISEKLFNEYDGKFESQLNKLAIDTKNNIDTRKSTKNALKNDISHFSIDYKILKQQLLHTLQYITIRKDVAICKMEGWPKQVIQLYRGRKLFKYWNIMDRIEQNQ